VQSERERYTEGNSARENRRVTHAGIKVNLVSAFQFMLNLANNSAKLRDVENTDTILSIGCFNVYLTGNSSHGKI
jgi:hypothetical protein